MTGKGMITTTDTPKTNHELISQQDFCKLELNNCVRMMRLSKHSWRFVTLLFLKN